VRILTRASIGALLVLLAVIGFAGPASAHAQLESTQPDPSSVLLTSPSQVVLHFGEPVEIDFGSLRVIGPDGKRVDLGGTHHPPGDSHAVAISLPPHLPDGTYVVAWRVISADSHPVHGAFIFSVGTANGAGKASSLVKNLNSAAGNPLIGVIFWLIRFAAFTSLVLVVGIPAVVTLVWPPGGRTGRIGRLLWTSWATLLFCSVFGIAIQGVYAAALPLTDIFRPSLFDEVLHTRFGEIEILRVILILAFVPVVLMVRRHQTAGAERWRWHWWIPYGIITGVGLLFTPGLAGHAGTGSDVPFSMALDVFHLGAVAVWFGGLAVLAALLAPGLRPEDRPEDVRRVAFKFSAYAFGAVIVVVATGVVQSLRQVGSFYALFNTVYGRTLVVKIGLVVVLIAVGAVSRRIVLGAWALPLMGRRSARVVIGPRSSLAFASATRVSGFDTTGIEQRPAERSSQEAHPAETVKGAEPADHRAETRSLRRSVSAEVLIALAVLAVTALLVNAAPAKQAASQPFSQSFNVLGVQVNAIVDPARVGPGNQFHFYVLGRSGQPTAIPELDAAISLPAQGIGPLTIPLVVATVGHFRATGVTIPLAGTWTLKLTVRTTAIDEDVVTATLPVH
jgi:copper transport protein